MASSSVSMIVTDKSANGVNLTKVIIMATNNEYDAYLNAQMPAVYKQDLMISDPATDTLTNVDNPSLCFLSALEILVFSNI